MSQRDSSYERKERDLYETPEWVTETLLQHLPERVKYVWEPACGNGKMAFVMPFITFMSDIEPGPSVLATFTPGGDDKLGLEAKDVFQHNFLSCDQAWLDYRFRSCHAIITNPPYNIATDFVEHALRLMEQRDGIVAMLLRTDFDHAKSRFHLFRDCPAFAMKLVLTRRIAWFVEANGKPKASPSYNHAWFVWDWTHEGPPTISYA